VLSYEASCFFAVFYPAYPIALRQIESDSGIIGKRVFGDCFVLDVLST
jgi:hypothetical protein